MRMITKNQIKALLDRKGWNQVDLAEACNVSQGTVSRWLKGTLPDPPAQTKLQKLIDAAPVDSKPQAAVVPTELSLNSVLAAVEGSYHMLGLDQDEATALLKIVIEVAAEQPTPSAGSDFHRVLAESSTRKFLNSKHFQRDGA
jgi:transcriptional regulator with XRE-family HTH domain